VPTDFDPSDRPALSENDAADQIKAMLRPAAPPKGADGRFVSANPPREPEHPDPEPESIDTDAASDAVREEPALGDDDIEIEAVDEADSAPSSSLDMPASYGPTARALWESLTPEQQQFLHQHDSKRTSGLSRQANELRAAQDQVKAQAEAFEKQRLQLAQAAQRLQSDAEKRFNAEFGDVKDLAALARDDPAKFIRYQAAIAQVHQAAQESNAWQMAVEQERVNQLNEFRSAENQKLAERYGLDDESKAMAFQQRVISFAEPIGITPQRLAQYTAEEISLLDDARKWRAAMAKRSHAEKQQASAPRVLKPTAPTNGASLRVTEEKQLSQQLKKTGSLDAAAALLRTQARNDARRR
jgi:pterin-4a-carbinolamine dehydratase